MRIFESDDASGLIKFRININVDYGNYILSFFATHNLGNAYIDRFGNRVNTRASLDTSFVIANQGNNVDRIVVNTSSASYYSGEREGGYYFEILHIDLTKDEMDKILSMSSIRITVKDAPNMSGPFILGEEGAELIKKFYQKTSSGISSNYGLSTESPLVGNWKGILSSGVIYEYQFNNRGEGNYRLFNPDGSVRLDTQKATYSTTTITQYLEELASSPQQYKFDDDPNKFILTTRNGEEVEFNRILN
jgi:hypothetical protein